MSFDDRSGSTQVQTDRDYSKARNQAFWRALLTRVRGETNELLNFEEVKAKLRLNDERNLGRQEVPLDFIVGSVGRYLDFDRKFLPKRSVSKDRWKAVDALTLSAMGYPPVELYKVGEAYFVLDGNHRVSVARANGMATIEAYVTEYRTDVPFGPDTKAEDLIIKEGYAFFLRETKLRMLRPKADVTLTDPSRYPEILHHIHVHHYFLGLERQSDVPWLEAVASWFDNVYMPMVRAMRKHRMLEGFTDRTEADLYVWLIKHQAEMRDLYDGHVMSPDETVGDFIQKVND